MLVGLAGTSIDARTPAFAQAPTAYLARGMESYQALEYNAAAGWLRRALTPPLVDGISPPDQVRALAYLGATERFRGRTDSAAAAFRRMLRLDPQSRPDPLVFPPEVTRFFDQVRTGYPIVRIIVPGDAIIDREHPSYRVALAASTPHPLALTLDGPDGRVADTLYAGPIGDTLSVAWDGRALSGAAPPSGRYWITATSVADGPRSCRTRTPIDLTTRPLDTLPLPAPLRADQLLPERAGGEEGPAALGKSAFFAVMALALPLIAKDAKAGQTRIVAGAIGAGGVVALIRYRPGRELPENVAANAVERTRWQRRVERVRAENADRRRSSVLRLDAGSSFTVGCDTQ
ncbi:MAG TPA: hypothetical protein VL295_05865 [Gemmatimonadales bacterium]|nr:hypothetical protein [Gemmatimonadales bacterium]